jgi:hypothetical protein
MTSFNYGPALDSELDYRRHSLLHDADVDRLAREARLFTRTARAAKRLVTRTPEVLTQRTAARAA